MIGKREPALPQFTAIYFSSLGHAGSGVYFYGEYEAA